MPKPKTSQKPKTKTKLFVIANWIGIALILYSVLAFFVPILVLKALNAIWSKISATSGAQTQDGLIGLYQILLPLLTVLPTFIFLKKTPAKLRPSFPMGKSNISMLVMIPIFLGVSILIRTISSFVNGFFVKTTTSSFPNTAVGILLYFVSFCIVLSVVEELLFRGMIQGLLQHSGAWFSIIVTASLYALMYDNLLAFANALLLGLVLCYCREITGSLSACIVLHFVNNLVVFLMIWVSNSMSAANAGAAAFMFVLIVIIIILFIAGIWAVNYFKLKDKFKIKTHKLKNSNTEKNVKILLTCPLFLVGMVFVIARFVLASIG